MSRAVDERAADEAVHGVRAMCMRASLAVAICFPFNVYLPETSFAFLVVGGLGIMASAKRFPWPPASLVISTLVLLLYLYVGVADGRDWRRCVVTSNHFFQFIFGTYAFLVAFHNNYFRPAELRRFFPILALAHAVSAVLTVARVGQQPWEDNPPFYEHNLLTFFTIFAFMRLCRTGRDSYALPALLLYILVLTALTDRISVQALSVGLITVTFFRVNPLVLGAVAIVIMVFPIYTALTLTATEMIRLIDLDQNTYMRMEFMRGAASVLKDSLLWGVGFGTDYRPSNYAYFQVHPLLNNAEELATVTNHHSIFDTYFRFGLVFGTIVLWPILRPLFASSRDRAVQAGVLFQAFGLSFNAYLENQSEIAVVCFASAMLIVKLQQAQLPTSPRQ